jgi:formate C-acetyltransferase
MFNRDFLAKKEWWGDDETILISEDMCVLPLIIRKALAIKYVANNMPIALRDDELIVGVPTMASVGFGKCFPKYTLPEEDAAALERGFTVKSTFGHHLINYETLLVKGVRGIRADILAKLSVVADDEYDKGKTEFYEAMLLSVDALSDLAKRYMLLLVKASVAEQDPMRRKELISMAEVCSKVPENPPETFHEALQSVFFAHVLLHSTMEMMPLGRVDFYLYPWYKKDIDEGRITEEQADEFVGSWIAKFSERINLKPDLWEMHQTNDDTQFNGISPNYKNTLDNYDQGEEFNFGTSGNHFFINMILGGQYTDGSDSTNDLTYLILEKWAFLELVSPVMSVRFHKDSPDRLYRLCADVLRRGSGEPALYNDEVIIKGLTLMGIPEEEARGYSNDGCWEAIIPGKTDFGFCMLQMLQLLEYLMQDGRSLIRGKQEWRGMPSLESLKTYEDFYTVFLRLLAENAQKEVETRLAHHRYRSEIAPSTLASAFMDDCIKRGFEYSNGGTRYSIFGMMLCGFANCVDSLAAIRKLVYEEKVVTILEFSKILRDNFRNNELFRQRCLNSSPKFGNDDEYADGIAVRLLDDFSDIISKLQKEYNGEVILGKAIATFEFFAKWGKDVGASSDGRFSGMPVATNFSPSMMTRGGSPTMAMKSVTKSDMANYGLGAPIDIKINSNETKGESGLNRLIGLIKSFLDLGGIMLTVTGVSDEEMRAAQREPTKHKNLRVRLGGLSAYFVALSKEVQDSIIERTSYSV